MKKLVLLVFLFTCVIMAQGVWAPQTSGTTNPLSSVSAVNDLVVWACGDAGTVLRTTNGGDNWELLSSAPFGVFDLLHIYSVSPTNAFVLGYDNSASALGTKMWATTDGGANWVEKLSSVAGFYNAMYFKDINNGIMYGDPVDGKWDIYRTNNGGSSWDTLPNRAPQTGTEAGWTNAMYGRGDHVYCGTNANTIYHSSDFGLTWTPITTHLKNSRSIYFPEDNLGYVAGSTNSNLNFTENGGTNWTVLPAPGSSGTIYNVIGRGPSIITTRGLVLYGTRNYGQKWDTLAVSTVAFAHITMSPQSETIWAVTAGGTIFKGVSLNLPVELTSFTANFVDGNVNLAWNTKSELNNNGFEIEKKFDGEFIKIGFIKGAGTSTNNNDYSFIDKNVEAGKIIYRLKQLDFDGSYTYSNEIEVTSIANSYALLQNYPNPFNPSTVIKYNLPERANVKLTIIDAVGQEVSVLVNGMQEAGVNEVNFNAANLASGIYFYKLETGNFFDVKKMMFVK